MDELQYIHTICTTVYNTYVFSGREIIT